MKDRIYLDREWKFTEKFEEQMSTRPMKAGADVTLPHTVKETPFHYFHEDIYQMESCYQRHLTYDDSWKNKKVYITFEAIGNEAQVWCNGMDLGSHHDGYTAWTLDLTDSLQEGDNLIAVRVDSRENVPQPPFGFVIDYMTYGGIYRDAYLTVTEPVHMEEIFYQPKVELKQDGEGRAKEAQAALTTEFTLPVEAIEDLRAGQLTIRQSICAEDGSLCENLGKDLIMKQITIPDDEAIIRKGQDADALHSLGDTAVRMQVTTEVGQVDLWDVEDPKLYHITTQLVRKSEAGITVLDADETVIGFREACFKADGFYLNGRKLKLMGVNRHQSFPYVGYAMPASMQKLDAKILKEELGLNAVRTSHYPQSQDFIAECDRLGLCVFTEIPGWQHIGDEAWKQQAIRNVKSMVVQYRNHPSIVLWGVRINESPDDDSFYERTNAMAHAYDPTRQTGGVRCIKKSNLLEDVYTYNDFVHSGNNKGCEPKKNVTSDMAKGYLVSEYNGHMYPTKPYDWEEHRRNHMMRHARVLNDVWGEADIAGSFAWCMFDYNTHKDFGSGDRICYHGVMDMFRNPKLAASVYAAQGGEKDVLEISSTMDIGEHPASNRGETYMISNADSIRMYKNDVLLKEYKPTDSAYKNLPHGPILIDDFIGDAIEKHEDFKPKQAQLVKYMMNKMAVYGYDMTPDLIWAAIRLVVIYHMKPDQAIGLFNKYVGDWGGASKTYRWEAVKDGRVVKTVTKDVVRDMHMSVRINGDEEANVPSAEALSIQLKEDQTYDVAEVRILARDQDENLVPFMDETIRMEVEGPFEIIGPDLVPFRGGMAGVYIKSTGVAGQGQLTLKCRGMEDVEISVVAEMTE